MAFCRVVFPLLVLSVISCYASSKVPVILWGDLSKNSLKSNPLTTYNTEEFQGILKQQLDDITLTIVFIEKTLSVEDFSLKNDDGSTSFPYLHDIVLHHGSNYLPSVDNATQTLIQIADPQESVSIEYTENGLSEDIAPKSSESGRFVFINLKDAREGESRADMLRRHDEFMQKTVEEMSKNEKVLAVYTAEYPSWTIPVTHSRHRRAAQTNTRTYECDGLRLYAKSIKLISGNNSTPLTGFLTSKSDFNETTMNTTLSYDNNTSIRLNFYQKGGYWFFDTVSLSTASLNEELFPNDEVYAIMGFSYRCQEHISFSSINETTSYTINFEDMKIQPFFEPKTNTTQAFGDSFNCIGFFSAPIWASLFVTFILLLITFYGIMMMLDIRTMDRFDDPKGKTITINTAE